MKVREPNPGLEENLTPPIELAYDTCYNYEKMGVFLFLPGFFLLVSLSLLDI